ncbi:probable tubulin polyglutamylase ttll-15 [Neocloeon triangulifer]|uniref:probable tubulin polyglutamylase ttll-15 n=1 Tax=Neocloeon triangulifer TaxID=2078957 RepID=UPI00286F84D3|nr:probable tubulin polyglutamylase ttll-15 [Neocloeon triangulifer]
MKQAKGMNLKNSNIKTKPESMKKNKSRVHGSREICYLTLVSFLMVCAAIFLTFFTTRTSFQPDGKIRKQPKDQNTGFSKNKSQPVVLFWKRNLAGLDHLTHIRNVFVLLGYKVSLDLNSDWDVLWAHDYPFENPLDPSPLEWQMKNLKPHQRVNKLPGSGFVTSKVELATSGGLGIPPAFRLPQDKFKLIEYARKNPKEKFLEKGNSHRSIRLKSIGEINLDSTKSFVQQFIANPLLIRGYFFDIGVYAIITSVDPLRIYRLDNDVAFRFCNEPYEPFDPLNVEKYVIADNYQPSYKEPVFQKYFNLSFPLKDAFDAHIRSIGGNPKLIWEQIDKQIVAAYLTQEHKFVDLLSSYKHKRNFFEMVRVDFILDDTMKIHLIEVNMSPSLSSIGYAPNGKRFEQVAFSLLSLVGLANYLHPPHQNSEEGKEVFVADRNVMVVQESCLTCADCTKVECQLCAPCLDKDFLADIKLAYKEHMNKYRAIRIFPPRMTQEEAKLGIPEEYAKITKANKLQYRWFQGRCRMDSSWC